MAEQKNIDIRNLEVNKGQIEGLPKNPRFIRDERFEALKKSIEDAPEMLALRELLVYPHEGKYVVIGGNMRLRACTDIGYKEVPCKVLDPGTPVEKLREYVIKDNEAFGQTDWDILKSDWDADELTEWGMELGGEFGTTEPDEPKKVVEDNFDKEQEVEARCQKGDIWLLGNHRLMCGDSTSESDVDRLMDGAEADLVFTDPPYGVSYVGINNPNGKEWKMIENDDLRGDSLYQFLEHAFLNIARTLKRGGGVLHLVRVEQPHPVRDRNSQRGTESEAGADMGQGHGARSFRLPLGLRAVSVRLPQGRQQHMVRRQKPEDVPGDEPHRHKEHDEGDDGEDAPRHARGQVRVADQPGQRDGVRASDAEAHHARGEGHNELERTVRRRPRPLRRQRKHDDGMRATRQEVLHDGVRPALLRRDHRKVGETDRQAGN